jgi:hypothetical protein
MLVEEMSVARRSAVRTVRSVGVAATLSLSCLFAAASANAADPPANIPLGSMSAACAQESSTECQRWLLGRLNSARATLGLPAYAVPGNFLSLSADRQIFILADLDRIAYGYTPISGLNAALDEAAAAGVKNQTDPLPPAAEGPWHGFGSDWASTGPLLAYYLWMYEDGYPGPNLDCSSAGASGCWGHRHVILGEGLALPQPLVVGVASGQSARGHTGTALIVSSHSGGATYYTWTQALSEGAGSGTPTGGETPTAPPPPPPPPTSCTRVVGRGTISISGLSGTVSNELTTSLTARQSLEVSVKYPPVGLIRLTSLTSASCLVKSAGREFSGRGSATLNGVTGYTVSFTFVTGGSKPTLSLQLTKGLSTPLRMSGIPLSASSELIS